MKDKMKNKIKELIEKKIKGLKTKLLQREYGRQTDLILASISDLQSLLKEIDTLKEE